MIILEEGQKAPEFSGTDSNGKKISLKQFRGRKLILYFYSEAGTPTCTIESCNLRDHYVLLKKNGCEVIGVSPDSITRQKNFEKKYSLPFSLISDEEKKIAQKYGVWDMKKLFGRDYMGILRTTFLIDEKGFIIKIFRKPRNKAHAQEVLAVL